jgi:hypothetical protein
MMNKDMWYVFKMSSEVESFGSAVGAFEYFLARYIDAAKKWPFN